jgi:hypothetical protein
MEAQPEETAMYSYDALALVDDLDPLLTKYQAALLDQRLDAYLRRHSALAASYDLEDYGPDCG